jgi:hypothetical protein
MIFGRVDEKGMEGGLARAVAASAGRSGENGGAHREMGDGDGQLS